MTLNIKFVQDASDLASCYALRRAVFMDEQNVTEAEEFDGEDDHCTHILACLNGVPVGAARLQPKGDAIKIQRVCISPAHRGNNFGADLIRFIMADAATANTANRLILGAQTHALSFYEKLGFTQCGAEYMDAGIPHIDMEHILQG